LHAQSDQAGLSGEWQIAKVEMKLFTQQDKSLVEAKTLTTDSAIRTINARVPVNVQFEGLSYMMRFRGSMESGTYYTKDSLIFLLNGNTDQSKKQDVFLSAIPYKYFFKNDTVLKIQIPASYYRDNTRNLAVKLECSCYYSKIK
jgi:hypothetical protein